MYKFISILNIIKEKKIEVWAEGLKLNTHPIRI